MAMGGTEFKLRVCQLLSVRWVKEEVAASFGSEVYLQQLFGEEDELDDDEKRLCECGVRGAQRRTDHTTCAAARGRGGTSSSRSRTITKI